ncbi:DUF6111 family protein [Azospirillum rugosum]|nr:DUF6111 family protein [Azospirillum rugosum]
MFLTVVVPLLLPTAGYILYIIVIERRRARAEETHTRAPWWVTAPWPWLLLAGAGLMGLTLGVIAVTSGAPPHSVYTPAHLENGRVVEGTQGEPAGGEPAGGEPVGGEPAGSAPAGK